MEYSFEIKKYKSGKELPVMVFEEGYELLTEFLFANATSVSIGSMIVEDLESIESSLNGQLNCSYNEINLKADENQAILSKETGEKLALATKDLIHVTKVYIIEVLKYKKK